MTGLEKSVDTKRQIVAAARERFASHGFAGASIRSIADSAKVNIAAISYHFGSKHNLYWAVVQETHDELDRGIELLAETNKTLQELVVATYRHLMEDRSVVRNAMKLLLTEEVPPPDGIYADHGCQPDSGPPGAAHFARVLKSQLKKPVSETSIDWAVESAFGAVLHIATICTSNHGDKIMEQLNGPKQIEHHLWFSTDALICYVELNDKKITKELGGK